MKAKIRSFFPDWLVNLFWHLPKAIWANLRYGFPSSDLVVIGVTGTDGKTTTATLIYEILLAGGKKAALISTVSAKIDREELPTGLHVTSPDAVVLQKLLKKIADQGIKYVVLEATSHGLAQYRLWGVNFQIGVVTNVTHEHLDYHQTYEKYLAAKAKLFQKVKVAILNRDDQSYEYLSSQIKRAKLITYAIEKKANYTPQKFPFKTRLPGQFNQYNCLAAIAAGKALELPEASIRKVVATFRGVVGRMDEIDLGQAFRVFVDFAHTPNALKQALTTLRKEKKKGRLIVVFGCAGLRDQSKRPLMGEIAGQLADLIVLTAEDPRTEDVNKIIDQIAVGCQRSRGVEGSLKNFDRSNPPTGLFFRIPDRREAIQFAIQKLAQEGDLVVLCGKGHEKSMCFGQIEEAWSEHQEAIKAIKQRLND